eukprot:TRINITY_DN23223_c0_g1_i1.p1 TRINITY_DN23223_c0_g1~~TRINITY_DN23223_c0_g1_i1.p1  ORF type:complete len:602 (-),score=64.35 TRINITY_DN23223_c0_g1_i1:220-1965(-)
MRDGCGCVNGQPHVRLPPPPRCRRRRHIATKSSHSLRRLRRMAGLAAERRLGGLRRRSAARDAAAPMPPAAVTSFGVDTQVSSARPPQALHVLVSEPFCTLLCELLCCWQSNNACGANFTSASLYKESQDLWMARLASSACCKGFGEVAVAWLTACLRHSETHVRRASARIVGRLQWGSLAEAAVPALVERALLPGSNAIAVAEAAMAKEALISLGTIAHAAIPVLRLALTHSEVSRKRCAALLLSKLGQIAASAVDALVVVLADDDFRVRSAAAMALGKIECSSTLKAKVARSLVKALNDASLDVREAAALSLGDLGTVRPCRASSRLANLAINDASSHVRRASTRALRLLLNDPSCCKQDVASNEATKAYRIVEEALLSKRGQIRARAAQVLGSLGQAAARAIPRLCKLISDEDLALASACTQALCSLGASASSAVPQFVALLRDGRATMIAKENAVRVLAAIGPAAAPAASLLLQHALSEERGSLRRLCKQALVASASALPALRKALDVKSSNWESWGDQDDLELLAASLGIKVPVNRHRSTGVTSSWLAPRKMQRGIYEYGSTSNKRRRIANTVSLR